MKKVHFISIILAVALCLAGCQSKNINTYETLAEGQERDWKIEDVLKNDLEIDGIPVSLPCTVGELLDTLGKNYSIEKGGGNLCYKGEETILYIFNSEGDNIEDCIAEGFQFMYFMLDSDLYYTEKGILKFTDFNDVPKQSEFVKKYTLPNELEIDDSNSNKQKANIRYDDGNCYMMCIFNDNVLSSVLIGYRMGGNENE